MEGTNINYIQDGNTAHDYTYYGNGCPDLWSGSGSSVACSSNTETTIDGETQEIGVYYDFQAASAGTGSSIGTANANTPDTFCPLGWQMPYGGTGGDYYDKSKSWRYLFASYSLAINPGDSFSSVAMRSYPFSMILAGDFTWYKGVLYVMTTNAYFWSSTVSSETRSYYLDLTAKQINNFENGRNLGNSIRCHLILAKLKSNHIPKLAEADFGIRAFHFMKAHFTSVKIMSNYLENEA